MLTSTEAVSHWHLHLGFLSPIVCFIIYNHCKHLSCSIMITGWASNRVICLSVHKITTRSSLLTTRYYHCHINKGFRTWREYKTCTCYTGVFIWQNKTRQKKWSEWSEILWVWNNYFSGLFKAKTVLITVKPV